MSAFFDLVRALIDGAGQVPILVWIAIIGFGIVVWLAYEIATAPLITDEQAEQIARAHRELRGTRGMPVKNAPTRNLPPGQRAAAREAVGQPRAASPSTRFTAPTLEGWNSPRHPATRGPVGPAHGRSDPRRDR